MLDATLRTMAQAFLPGPFQWCRSYRVRRGFRACFGAEQRLFRAAFYPGNRLPEVLTGPFKGMSYFDETVWGSITPKWAGSYEMEVADIIEGIVPRRYDRLLNLGSAEGYYAVGMALRDPDLEVLAFDIDPFARQQLHRLTRLNQVTQQVHVFGGSNPSQLNERIERETLIIADLEGHETVLLDPHIAPKLKETDLLIEIHDDPRNPGHATTEQQITNRFAASHWIERRISGDREAWLERNRSLWQGKVSREQMAKALHEARGAPQVWLWLNRNALPRPEKQF